MLIFKKPISASLLTFFYLNTSHVDIQDSRFRTEIFKNYYLNTSHVDIQAHTFTIFPSFISNLNTSHVDIQDGIKFLLHQPCLI